MAKATPCQSDSQRPALSDSFVMPDGVRKGTTVRASRMGKRRALVLIGIHLAVFLHILHWKLQGRTISPLEPSEAMYTLLHGTVNAGAILLLLSLASTLVFGRFFCGWACHLVAVQDFCAWLLKKIGIRPRPLRSKWLMWVPLGAGLYMFLIGPLGGRHYADQPLLPDFEPGMYKTEFWETFPGPWVSVLTFVFVGGVMIYLLGAKGFCTYACPYGGLFGVVDRYARGRIRVTDACKACGHCSAVCTSNVLIHKEVHEYGMVVDPGCMKCLDCVSVCPENALYFGFGKSAAFTKPAREPKARIAQFTLGEELAMFAVFAFTLATFAGLPAGLFAWAESLNGQTPLLFSLGLATTTAFVAVFAWRLFFGTDVGWSRFVMKEQGRRSKSGNVALCIATIWLLFVLDCAFVQFNVWRGVHLTQTMDLYSLAFDPNRAQDRDLAPNRQRLDAAEAHYRRARSLGVLSFLDLRLPARLGGLEMARGRAKEAIPYYEDAVAIDPEFAPSYFDLSQAYWMAIEPEKAVERLLRAIELAPADHQIRQGLGAIATQLGSVGAIDLAGKCIRALTRADPDSENYAIAYATYIQSDQGTPQAIVDLSRFVGRHPEAMHARAMLGLMLLDAGQPEPAVRELQASWQSVPDFPDARNALVTALRQLGRDAEADALPLPESRPAK